MASSVSVVLQQPAGVVMKGSAGLHAATSSRVVVSLPTMLGGQVKLGGFSKGVSGQRVLMKRRMVVAESRAVTDGPVSEAAAQRVKKAMAEKTIMSPNLAKKWRQVAGADDWEGMLDPLDADVRNELIRYGEFAQATYDSFDSAKFSKFRGSCRHRKDMLLESAGLADSGYKVTKFLYTTTNIKSLLLINESDDPWSRNSNWMGYVAVCTDEERIKRMGRRDIVVAWRGTIEKLEWAANIKRNVTPSSLDDRDTSDGFFNPKIGMEEGFLSLYVSKNPKMRYNKKSVREQLLDEINRLIAEHDNETLSITITGHSLGAALALLSAYDIAESGINGHHNSPPVPTQWNEKTAEPTPSSSPADAMKFKSVPITVMSFAGPRVGNSPFAKRVKQLGVKVLRAVNVNDFVPKVPGLIFSGLSESLDIFDKAIVQLPCTYSHCGVELQLNNEHSPFLKPMPLDESGIGNRHNLEAYLHLVSGYQGRGIGIGEDFKLMLRRDIALVNKSSDALVPHKYIPSTWFQLPNKGLVLNEDFEWVQVERDTEDIPSPDKEA